MTKLHSPRGWLGYFVGCESEAMYHIYSPEKHKVYRIGVARVEDGEGLDDSHDGPCLEDRVPTPDVEVLSDVLSEDENETSSDSGSDHNEDDYSANTPGFPVEQINQTVTRNMDNSPSSRELHIPETTHESQDGVEDADDEDEDSEAYSGTRIVSKYWNRFSHAGMAKRKIPEDTIVVPKNSRRATHDLREANENDPYSDISDSNDDSWYYSEDGAVSQAYWRFITKHGGNHMKTFLPDDNKCDRCFRNGRRCDAAENGRPCSTCRNDNQACRPQSKTTRRLVLPENRHRKKQIGRIQQDQPCRRCFQISRTVFSSTLMIHNVRVVKNRTSGVTGT